MPAPKSYLSRDPKIKTQAQMLEVLRLRTAGKAEPMPQGAAKPQALTERPAAPLLAWMDPVKHGDGTGFQVESTGRYSVVRERDSARGPQAFVYRLFDRTDGKLLGTYESAQAAREAAQA